MYQTLQLYLTWPKMKFNGIITLTQTSVLEVKLYSSTLLTRPCCILIFQTINMVKPFKFETYKTNLSVWMRKAAFIYGRNILFNSLRWLLWDKTRSVQACFTIFITFYSFTRVICFIKKFRWTSFLAPGLKWQYSPLKHWFYAFLFLEDFN